MKTEPITKKEALSLARDIINTFDQKAIDCQCLVGEDNKTRGHVISVHDKVTRKSFTICLYQC